MAVALYIEIVEILFLYKGWSGLKNIKNNSLIEKLNERKLLNEKLAEIEYIFDEESGVDVSILGESVEFEPLFHEVSYVDEVNKLDEAKAVTFGGAMFPQFGWAVVMAGGAGSGKGYSIENTIALDAKIFDVDKLKELYVSVLKADKAGSKIKAGDDKVYDMKKSQDVFDLHMKIEQKDYDKSRQQAFFKSADKRRLPNLIFDITGKTEDKLVRLGKMLKEMGYKTSLVWVVTNREVAILRNLSRSRVVGQELLHDIHNKVNKTVFPFLESNKAGDYDEAWVVFSSPAGLKELSAEEKKEFAKMNVVRFDKIGSSFAIPDAVHVRVAKTLGPQEVNPKNPQTYKQYDDIKKELEPFAVKKTSDKNYQRKMKSKTDYENYGDLSFKKVQ